MRLALAAAIAVILSSGSAHADRAWKRRYLHLGAIGAGSIAYALTESPFKADLAPDACRWCDPPGFDASARNALVWKHPGTAGTVSSLTGFVIAPAVALGLLWASSWSERSAARWIDDAVPVLEAAVLFGLVDQAAKFGFGRQRPFVHYADPSRPAATDDNLSFFSGHTGSGFAIATAAGTVAHLRHARLEPVIWGTGLVLASATGYLRMAADKHWLSDVLVGAAVGSGIGLALPRLLHRRTLTVVPAGEGVLVSGVF